MSNDNTFSLYYDADKVNIALSTLESAKDLFPNTEIDLESGANKIKNANGYMQYVAIKSGTIDPEQLSIKVQESKDIIDKVYFDIKDMQEKIEKLQSGEEDKERQQQ